MTIEHACFISFPRGVGNDTEFADHFYEVFRANLATFDKQLSVFKFDRCEDRRQGDDWTKWLQRELCGSAMMMAVCAPNYFNGSPACVSEFRGMETLIRQRTDVLGNDLGTPPHHWLLGLRLKDTVPMPALDLYPVRDFFDCAVTPKKVKSVERYRKLVHDLAELVHRHWCWLHEDGRAARLHAAGICRDFRLPREQAVVAPPFPFTGGVR